MDNHVNGAVWVEPFFFIHALEAQVTLASTLAKLMLMMFLFNG
jgi:hypothetical protein